MIESLIAFVGATAAFWIGYWRGRVSMQREIERIVGRRYQ